MSITPEILSENLIPLIDCSIIEVDGNGYYLISTPVKESIIKLIPRPQKADIELLVNSLKEFLDNPEIETPKTEVSGLLFQASRRIGRRDSAEYMHHISDVIELAESSYHCKEYGLTIEYTAEALQHRPNNLKARDYLIRALIQEERWSEAELEIGILSEYAPAHDVQFLKGFKSRMMGRFNEAIDWYNRAVKSGRKGAAVKRELATCYLRINDIQSAKETLI